MYLRYIRNRKWNSGKFRLQNRLLYDKRPTKNDTLLFPLFLWSNFNIIFAKNFMKKYTIFKTFSKFLLYGKIYVSATTGSKKPAL